MQLKLEQAIFRLRRAIGPLAALALSLLAVGCANPGRPVPPAAMTPPESIGFNAGVAMEPVALNWWRELGDEQLTRLIERSIDGAPGLKLARARLARAQALTDQASAAFAPQVNGAIDLNRQRFSEYGLVPVALAGAVRNLGTVQGAFSWELDFFGRNQAALESALGAQRAARAEVDAARALLASQVARTYLQLARLIEQREILRAVLAQREQTAALLTQRVAAGLDNAMVRQQALAGVAEIRVQSAALEDSIGLARNALAALSAQPPAALEPLAPQLPALMVLPVPADVPADLVGRRADLAAARSRVESSVQDVMVARTLFYPNINLIALVGVTSIGLDRLLRPGSLQASAGPAIRLPIFEGGRLRANLQARQAELDAAIESYNQVLLDAVREVADQLGTLRAIARQQPEQAQASQIAESLQQLALQRYRSGVGNRLAVLAAEGGVLAQRQLANDLRARLLDAQFGLIRALGGGYAADVPGPSARQATKP